MNKPSFARPCRLTAAGLLLSLLAACSALRSTTAPPPSFYLLDRPASPALAARTTSPMPLATAPTLLVNPPHAATGFDSQRLIYVREAHKLDYFAHSEWADTPPRMIAPLIVDALEGSVAFAAVVRTPSAAAGDLKLDTEILRLQHEFGGQPSKVRFTLRAYVIDNTTRRVLAWREFDASVSAASDDAPGGVAAANVAVQEVLRQLADFCRDLAASWQPAAKP